MLGVKGEFNEDWRYEVSLNYGKFKQDLKSENNRVQQRFRLATDAVRNSAGQIVCRSQLPGQVTPFRPARPPATRRRSPRDIAACVPINLFGEGAPSQAAIDYINVDTTSIQKQEQKVASAYVTGDSSAAVRAARRPDRLGDRRRMARGRRLPRLQ